MFVRSHAPDAGSFLDVFGLYLGQFIWEFGKCVGCELDQANRIWYEFDGSCLAQASLSGPRSKHSHRTVSSSSVLGTSLGVLFWAENDMWLEAIFTQSAFA